jgi:hypothetical protein
MDCCDAPTGYDVNTYEFFQGTSIPILGDKKVVDISI